ncbi:MAG TPA: hypothetical protein VFZ40_05985 [Pyrinomonadaceae bacterium]
MAKPREGKMDQRLRWMSENVHGAYNARHPDGHIKEGGDDHCTNSGTCILVSCYMEALGKVLMRGKDGPGRRFKEFIERCMPDLDRELKATGIINPHAWFYGNFRSAFVHGYPKPWYAWKRGGSGKYFLKDKHKKRDAILNIDEFVAGFERGLKKFKECAVADRDLEIKFIPYITK